MMRYAFINADSIVVQVISGTLNPAQQAQFLRDYATLFGATAIIEVEDGTSVWIGGAYLGGVFAPPPQPEPEPETIEGTSEMIEEPIAMIDEMQPEPLPEIVEPEIT
jgi:hypothetical protein